VTEQNFVRPGRRLWIIVVALLVAAALALSADVHQSVIALIAMAGPLIARSPLTGALVFVLLSALSAMVVFFSGLLLVPVGVQVWGPTVCFLLLWLGWFMGGLVAYLIGRFLGRPAVQRMLSTDRMAYYEARLPQIRTLGGSLLVQLALPSDVTGYFFGLLKVPAPLYLGGLLLAELPYAFGTVFAGAAFVERQYKLLLWLAGIGLAAMALAVHYRRRNRKAR
jgi:uncharacterized membrane protein YdjX (TVP38/TMEM64 family)